MALATYVHAVCNVDSLSGFLNGGRERTPLGEAEAIQSRAEFRVILGKIRIVGMNKGEEGNSPDAPE